MRIAGYLELVQRVNLSMPLSDPWVIRTRSVLVRALTALPASARALVAELVKAEAGGRGNAGLVEH